MYDCTIYDLRSTAIPVNSFIAAWSHLEKCCAQYGAVCSETLQDFEFHLKIYADRVSENEIWHAKHSVFFCLKNEHDFHAGLGWIRI